MAEKIQNPAFLACRGQTSVFALLADMQLHHCYAITNLLTKERCRFNQGGLSLKRLNAICKASWGTFPSSLTAAMQSRLVQAPLVVEADVLGPSDGPIQSRSDTFQAGSQLARPQQHDSCLAETTKNGSSYQAQRCSHLLRHTATVQNTTLVHNASPYLVTKVVGAIEATVISLTFDMQEAAKKEQACG